MKTKKGMNSEKRNTM